MNACGAPHHASRNGNRFKFRLTRTRKSRRNPRQHSLRRSKRFARPVRRRNRSIFANSFNRRRTPAVFGIHRVHAQLGQRENTNRTRKKFGSISCVSQLINRPTNMLRRNIVRLAPKEQTQLLCPRHDKLMRQMSVAVAINGSLIKLRQRSKDHPQLQHALLEVHTQEYDEW